MNRRQESLSPKRFGSNLGLLALMCLSWFVCGLDQAAKAEQMNVLFIAIDDLKRVGGYMSEEPESFLKWIYPNPAKRAEMIPYLTPNLDRLASEGVAFTHAHCAAPACNPSRTALMIGMRPVDTGITNNGDGFFRESSNPDIRNAVTLSQNLIAHGYYALGLGKIYHGNSYSDPEKSWVDWLNQSKGTTGPAVESVWSPVHTNPGTNVKIGYVTGTLAEQNDYINADFVATLMENGVATIDEQTITLPPGKPFFLACGLTKPHLPFYSPKDIADLFDANDLDLTREKLDRVLADVQDLSEGGKAKVNLDPDGTITSGTFNMVLEHGLSLDSVDGDLKAWRDLVKYYLASAAFADRCVGRLLEGLENSPYADNTLVVLWSDHGWNLGEKYWLKKFTLWNESSQCVLIIKDPTESQSAGTLCRHPVNLQDLYRTINSKCGVPVATAVAGRDISHLLAEPESVWDHAALCTTDYIDHTIRSIDYRYIRFDNDPNNDELYDEVADPNEFVNLIDEASYNAVESWMESWLDDILAYAPRMQACYLFEDNTDDSSGNGNDGTAFGGPAFSAGIAGTQAILLDGTDDYVEIPRLIEDDFTIALWVKTTHAGSAGSDWNMGSGMVAADGVTSDLGVSLLGSKVAFGIGAPDTTVISVSNVNDGFWHHVAATRDGASGQIKLYVDGVEEGSGAGAIGAASAASVMNIGKTDSPGGYFKGSIDDLRLYNLVLSAGDIAVIMDMDAPSPDPAAFASGPAGLSRTEIAMTAVEGTDAGIVVEYYFDETSGNPGGTDSGWQNDPVYIDADLDEATEYSYTVTMRDGNSNETHASDPAVVYTHPNPNVVDDLTYDINDLIVLAANWLRHGCYTTDPVLCDGSDLNADTRVNQWDLSILSGLWHIDLTIPEPLAWYWFENAADDSSGTNHGVENGGLVYDTGTVGSYSVRLDGIDDFVEISRPVEDDWTIALWIQTDNLMQAGVSGTAYRTGRGLVDSDTGGQNQSWAMTYELGKIECGTSSDTGAAGLKSVWTNTDTQWHHVAWTRQASTGEMQLFIDGVLDIDGQHDKWIGTKDTTSRTLIGSQAEKDGEYFEGRIDDVRFYDYILSSDIIAQLAGK